MAEGASRARRVERLLAAAEQLADRERPAGRAWRERLLATSGLSAEGIELGIARCLESRAGPAELAALLESTPEAPRAHVLLSGNVFVAALRAVALGVAASERVFVRASRRDPALAEALHALCPDSFQLVPELQPRSGDRVWAYGADATLDQVRAELPRGVWFHAHGHGLGAVVLDPRLAPELEGAARDVALDAVLFDQRGCLSPRVVCVLGEPAQALPVASALARALQALEEEVPPGPRSPEALAEMRRQRDAATYAFQTLPAGTGWVSLSPEPVVPPAERCLHVVAGRDALETLSPLARRLTCIGAEVSPALKSELRARFPGARVVGLGEMQRPPLDGPVDRRGAGELLA